MTFRYIVVIHILCGLIYDSVMAGDVPSNVVPEQGELKCFEYTLVTLFSAKLCRIHRLAIKT